MKCIEKMGWDTGSVSIKYTLSLSIIVMVILKTVRFTNILRLLFSRSSSEFEDLL